MNKQSLLILSIALISSVALSSCGHRGGSHASSQVETTTSQVSSTTASHEILTSQNETTSEENTSSSETQTTQQAIIIKRLQITNLPNKLEYEVGEAFTSDGLSVNLVETKNGEVISSNATNDYTLSIKDGTILEEGEFEVIIKASDKQIRSTSFTITVKVSKRLLSLYEVVSKMVELNNYTVDNDLGQNNKVKGLITKNALIWDATEEAYFMDEDFGYGTYQDKTFRFNLTEQGEITNAIYLTDLGGNAEDNGLFSSETFDDLAERRISNYNISEITNEDLDYLKNDIKPTLDNPNRYLLSLEHCKWLFNAIAHTQLTINPYYFLTSGSEPAKIWLEVKDYGLDVDLITFDTFGVRGCSARITNIGTTKIPGMDEFMKNPVFGKPKSNLDKLHDNLVGQNYEFIFNDEARSVVFTDDYVYGAYLDCSTINLKNGNKLNKAPGDYQMVVNETSIEILEPVSSTLYLLNFDLFNNLDKYFVQDQIMLNRYTYLVENSNFESSGLKLFLDYFTSYTNEQISQVNLEFMMAGDSLYQVSMDILSQDQTFDSIIITNFGQASHEVIESYVTNLY